MRKLFAAIALSTVSQTAAADTLTLDPDPDSFLLGQPQSLTYPDQAMGVSQTQNSVEFSSPAGALPSWRVSFQSPTGQELRVGCYERTANPATAQRAGMSIIFGQRSCFVSNARFKVLDVQRASGSITRFAADFSAPCGTLGRVVRGRLRYDSQVPADTPLLRPTFDVSGTMTVVAEPGAIGGGAAGTTRAFNLSRSFFRLLRGFDNSAEIFYSEFVVGGPSSTSWTLSFAAPDFAPLQVGAYPNATRYPLQAAGVPGLDYSFGSSGCNQVFGSFNVTAITYDAYERIPLRLAASFLHRCQTMTAPIASGTISYDLNAIGPTTIPNPEILFASGMEPNERVGFFTPTCDE